MRGWCTASSGRLKALGVLMLIVGPALLLSAQDKNLTEPDPFQALPFERWVREGSHQEIRWKTRVFYVGLSNDQRLIARLEVTVDGKELTSRGNKGRIIALIKFSDSAGHVYLNDGKVEMNNLKPYAKNSDVQQTWDSFVLPGDYTVAVALYHTETKEHNFAVHKLHVPALKNDPLPNVWQGLPEVEFWAPIDVPEQDVLFHPEIEGRLHLPLATHSALHLEVLVDLSASDLFHGSEIRYNRYLHAVVPALKTLTQIEMGDGILDLVTLDLLQRRVTFEQDAVKNLDWPVLRNAIKEMGPTRVSVQVLKTRDPSPVFLRDEVARRIAVAHSEPLHVFILIGSPLSFYSFRGLGSSPLPADCHCHIYYLEYDSSYRHEYSAIGNVKKMLSPLKIKAFSVHSPQEVRRVLARILNELSEM